MSTEFNLRRWIAKQPHPNRVNAEFEDGSKKTTLIGVSRSKFRDAEEVLRGAIWLQAVDADGNVLREWSDESFVEAAEKKSEETKSGDSNALLGNFATLLAGAYENGAKAHAEAYKMAFELMALLCNTIIGRNAALEKVLLESIQNQPESAETDPNAALVQQAIMALASGALSPRPPPPVAPNGAAQ